MSDDELVARWMGWRCLRDGNGAPRWVRPNTPPDANIMACAMEPPPYRTDPAFLFYLIERLTTLRWYVGRYEGLTLAESVFAAAVAQAKAETPSEYTAEVPR